MSIPTRNIYSVPQYQKLAAGYAYNLSLTSDNSGVSAMNISPMCLEFDFTDDDNLTLLLPPISDFLKYRSAGIGFQINGTVIGGVGTVTIQPHYEEGNEDFICGDSVKEFTGATCKIYIAGSHNWGIFSCSK